MLKQLHKTVSLPGHLVFIHGNSSNANVFNGVLQHEKFRYNASSISLPGHGFEGKTGLNEEFSIASLQNTLKMHVQAIKEPILLVGHSLGGHLAIEVAPFIPNLKGLCIIGTPPTELPLNFDSAFNGIAEMSVLFEAHPENGLVHSFLQKSILNARVRDKIRQDYLNTHPTVRTRIARGVPDKHWSNQRAIFKALQVPKFMVQGKGDPFINGSYLEEIKAENGPNCTLTIFEHCGHYPMLEVPNTFISYIIDVSHHVFDL